MAEAKENLLIFKQYRPILPILEAFNVDNFRHESHGQRVSNIAFAVCVSAVVIIATAGNVLGFWYCVENGLNMDILSDSMPIILSLSQMLLVHISLTTRNRLIFATFQELGETINEREFFFTKNR